MDILTPLREACDNCPFLLDTDVNAPAALEYALATCTATASQHDDDNHKAVVVGGSSVTTPTAAETVDQNKKKKLNNNKNKKRISSCAYVTVGTGVGVGLVVNGTTVRGFLHPEGGHIPVPPLPGDTFGGYSWGQNANVPFGGMNTVEALASSVALLERYEQELVKVIGLPPSNVVTSNNGRNRQELANVPDESDIWDHAVNAIATLCTTMILLLSMERIVLGGGVMQRPMLLAKIRVRTKELLNDYVPLHRNDDDNNNDEAPLDQMIVVSTHGKDAGYVVYLYRKFIAWRDLIHPSVSFYFGKRNQPTHKSFFSSSSSVQSTRGHSSRPTRLERRR